MDYRVPLRIFRPSSIFNPIKLQLYCSVVQGPNHSDQLKLVPLFLLGSLNQNY